MLEIWTAELVKKNSEIYSVDLVKSNVYNSLKIPPPRNVEDSDLLTTPILKMLKELFKTWIKKNMMEENWELRNLKEVWDTKELPADIWVIPDPIITVEETFPPVEDKDHQEETEGTLEITEREVQEAVEDSLDPDLEKETEKEEDTEEIIETIEIEDTVANLPDTEKEVIPETDITDTDPETDQAQETEDKKKKQSVIGKIRDQIHKKFRVK